MKAKATLKKKKLRESPRAVAVDDTLRSGLTNPAEAAAYVEACLQEKGALRTQLLLRALMDIAKAHGLSRLAGGSESRRRGIYKALGEDSNPSLQTLEGILEKLGLELGVKAKSKRSYV
jgi:probable addiction module antidote protein